jgi:chromatin modification-related protein VID21
VDVDDRSVEDRLAGFEAWKISHSFGLGGSSRPITSLALPELPPLSPPPGVTVFPDEAPEPSTAATYTPTPLPLPAASHKRAISPSSPSHAPGEPVAKRPRVRTPQPPTPPPDTPPATINPRDFFRQPFSPVQQAAVPDWVPLENYLPAATPPRTPPTIPMPLANAYTSTLPPLPPAPAQQPNRRQRKKDDKQGITKLYAQFAVNPLSDAMSRSSKCVLTSDWRVATQELRHIRAMERIEAKKAEGRWSLRQPKKGRGIAVVKAHWDYLLEEMVCTLCE